jgi:hypothetical protein
MKGGRHHDFRARLKERGWPIIDPPLEYTKRLRFRGSAQHVLPRQLRDERPQVAKGRRFS